MSTYHAPLADMRFVLFDLLDAEQVFSRLGFSDATRDVLDVAGDVVRVAKEVGGVQLTGC